MTDLAQRLREMASNKIWVGCTDANAAADRIKELERENAELRK